jgi:RNA polymerase sigma factor (sigma-70 family)
MRAKVGLSHSKLRYMSEPKTLAEVLAALPDEERIILVMHYLRSMPPSEIAQKLGVPERSVTAVIALGKARLSKVLGL